jgi:hypothetical protein
MRKLKGALALVLACTALTAQAQRQLLCEPDQECSITCYQDDEDKKDSPLHRDKVDRLYVDINARVLQIETRDRPENTRAYDYWIIGSETSCVIENMRGIHD